MELVPVSDLLRQLILAVGAALLVGNLAVVVRERRRKPSDPGPRPNWKIVALNIVIGAVLTIWGAVSIIVAR